MTKPKHRGQRKRGPTGRIPADMNLNRVFNEIPFMSATYQSGRERSVPAMHVQRQAGSRVEEVDAVE